MHNQIVMNEGDTIQERKERMYSGKGVKGGVAPLLPLRGHPVIDSSPP